MTKLLILSDSHNSRLAIENILAAEADSIDALIFLGDGLRDLEQALTFYPSLRAYAVAGNCDFGALEPLDGLAAFDGVVVFYTHGHMYGVKYDLDTLADAAAARGANVALFGHTHIPVAEAFFYLSYIDTLLFDTIPVVEPLRGFFTSYYCIL